MNLCSTMRPEPGNDYCRNPRVQILNGVPLRGFLPKRDLAKTVPNCLGAVQLINLLSHERVSITYAQPDAGSNEKARAAMRS
jgi:hypothetical protein